MKKLEWAALVAVAGIVAVTQIPRHDHEGMPGHQHERDAIAGDGQDLTARSEPASHKRTVTLLVTGMT